MQENVEKFIDDIWFVLSLNVFDDDNKYIRDIIVDKFLTKFADDFGIFLRIERHLDKNVKYLCSIFPSIYGDKYNTSLYDESYDALKDGLMYAINIIKMQDHLYSFIQNHCKPGQKLVSLDYGEVEFVKCENKIITCKTDDKYLFYTSKGIPCYWSDEHNCWRYDDKVTQKLFICRGL